MGTLPETFFTISLSVMMAEAEGARVAFPTMFMIPSDTRFILMTDSTKAPGKFKGSFTSLLSTYLKFWRALSAAGDDAVDNGSSGGWVLLGPFMTVNLVRVSVRLVVSGMDWLSLAWEKTDGVRSRGVGRWLCLIQPLLELRGFKFFSFLGSHICLLLLLLRL